MFGLFDCHDPGIHGWRRVNDTPIESRLGCGVGEPFPPTLCRRATDDSTRHSSSISNAFNRLLQPNYHSLLQRTFA